MTFWKDDEQHCLSRYGLWAYETGSMTILAVIYFIIGLLYQTSTPPIAPMVVSPIFMALAWRDRRRWMFHRALNRLTKQPQFPLDDNAPYAPYRPYGTGGTWV